MKNSKFIYVIVVVFCLLIGVGIFFNPYTDINYLNANPTLCLSINSFFEKLGLGYRFSLSDVVYLMRFTEYFIFGIITTMIIKVHSKNIWKNVCTPLFFGLVLSFGEVYFKSFSDLKIGLYEVLLSFIYFCVGLLFYLIISKMKFSSGKSCGFKFNKYGRRR